MDKESISIYTIAREAAVSPATVSRVLTGNARVSEEKRDKVKELIEKYDFKPNPLARGLSNIESRIIGIMISDIRNPFYATLAVECERAASKKGYMLMLCNSLGSNEMEFTHLEKLAAQRVDAIIQIGGKVDEWVSDSDYVEAVNRIANTIPILITGKLDGADCYQLSIDEGKSMELVLEFLIHNGHRDIAIVGGRGNVKTTLDKRFRYRQILRKYSIVVHEEYIVNGNDYDVESGYEAMQQFMEQGYPMPSAVIAINDFTAIGVIRSLQERGMHIPKDICVASFDNTFIAEASFPRLTSVDYNYKLFGEQLIDTAIQAIRKENPPRVQLITPRLIVRESSPYL